MNVVHAKKNKKHAPHPSSSSYRESGCSGSSLSREAQDPPPLTRIPRHSQASSSSNALGLAGCMRPETPHQGGIQQASEANARVTSSGSSRWGGSSGPPLSSSKSVICPGDHSLSHYPQILQRSSMSFPKGLNVYQDTGAPPFFAVTMFGLVLSVARLLFSQTTVVASHSDTDV